MAIDGFTYVRNGQQMGYPFVASIQSLLPLVDRLFVVVGDSEDDTRVMVENIGDPKIKIIDTVWDMEQRSNGSIFRMQSNLGLDQCTAEWCFHLQVDEVLHEKDYDAIRHAIAKADTLSHVDGLLFPFLHFWGDYNHIRNTRATHSHEIRAFKNNRNVRSYRDSQGFRIFNPAEPDDKGKKLKVIAVDASIYHYSYTRHPKLMGKKNQFFHRFWHDDAWINDPERVWTFDYNYVDKLEQFTGTHPQYMNEVIAQKDWDFDYDPEKSVMTAKEKLLYRIEKQFGYRLFAYKNYQLLQAR